MGQSAEPRTVQCVFYSHVWATHLLGQSGLGDLADTVLVELAPESNLAHLFQKHSLDRHRYGLAAVLAARDCLKQLASTYKNVPAPLILAGQPAVPVTVQESAVSVLATAEAPFHSATLLVHVNDAPLFAGAYGYVDRFSVLWDIADLPNAALERLARLMVDEACLHPARWCGFNLVSHPLRPLVDAAQRYSAMRATLNAFPATASAA